ncbi:unnamed protein product [Vicia faba]|uniref:Uncharacterized protein n=1 Tax=Vicia faba TaxID=3906 RepID=A0AAV1AG10_VICFA|nr:unnamed protein product [Vicia faba]
MDYGSHYLSAVSGDFKSERVYGDSLSYGVSSRDPSEVLFSRKTSGVKALLRNRCFLLYSLRSLGLYKGVLTVCQVYILETLFRALFYLFYATDTSQYDVWDMGLIFLRLQEKLDVYGSPFVLAAQIAKLEASFFEGEDRWKKPSEAEAKVCHEFEENREALQ